MPSEVVRIEDASGSSAEVLISQGFNCFSWRPSVGGGRERLWAEEGFAEGDKRPSRSGIPLLFPFPGRIQQGQFAHGGRSFQIDASDGLGNALHGFSHTSPWRVVEQTADSVSAEHQLSVDNPQALPQWTGDYLLRATYRVSAGELLFDFAAQNTADKPLPFGFGTHAYFRLPLVEGADAEETLVAAQVDAVWELEGLVPTGKSTPIAPGDPITETAPLGGRAFDTVYGLKRGAAETVLADNRAGVEVVQRFDESMRCCVVYVPDHREAICLEPYTCIPNLFALEEQGVDTGLRVLAPGEKYQTRVVLETRTNS